MNITVNKIDISRVKYNLLRARVTMFEPHNYVFIDLRSAQVYCVAIFLVSQEVSLNFHRCCG